eukprot:COSAG05_NODE_17_length_35518_cov_34.728084_34_plen_492_part_00
MLKRALNDPCITSWEAEVCERAWGGSPGQAIVERLRLRPPPTANNDAAAGRQATVIAKRARIPTAVKGSCEKADDKLCSLRVEAAFLRECSPKLADAGAAAPLLYHEEPAGHTRASLVLMSDLRAEFPRSLAELDVPHAHAALDWLARFHAAFWSSGAPDQLLPAPDLFVCGSYYDLTKAQRVQQCCEAALRKNWIESVEDVPELEALGAAAATSAGGADLPAQLAALAVPLHQRLFPHSPVSSSAAAPAHTAAKKKRSRRGGKVRTAAAKAGAEPASTGSAALSRLVAAVCARQEDPPATTPTAVLHGDYKAENMCFSAASREEAHSSGSTSAPRCAVFDFQWAGAGAPAVDVVYLLFTSLGALLDDDDHDDHEADADSSRGASAGSQAGQGREPSGTVATELEAALLDYYHSRLGVHGVDIGASTAVEGGGGIGSATTAVFDRAMLQRQYEWALLDFARFALADGALIESDLGWVRRCVGLLAAMALSE